MEITNKRNLPKQIIKALKRNRYKKGNCDYSVTELLKPSYMNHIEKKQKHELRKDASEMLYSLYGSVLHNILKGSLTDRIIQRIKNIFCNTIIYTDNKRITLELDNTKIKGTPDYVEIDKKSKTVIIKDYKMMGVWEYMNGVKEDKEAQLNIYALYFRLKGYEIKKLELVAFFKDHSLEKAEYKKDYPDKAIKHVYINMWNSPMTRMFVCDRINAHSYSSPCSKKEMWVRDEKYAVMKEGRKSAVRLKDTLDEAQEYVANDTKGKGYYIDHRPGKRVRCERYCIVKDFCPEWKEHERGME